MKGQALARSSNVSRRALLTAGILLPLAGCNVGARPLVSTPRSGTPAPTPDTSRLKALEGKYDARLGVYALDTGTGSTVAYRADARFAFCSTFKTIVSAAVLDKGDLDKSVTVTKADVDSISPIVQKRIGDKMTMRELCDAAIRYSDGTAGNLLMRDIGGPAKLTAYLRKLGDTVSRMDRYEPGLNRDKKDDPRDTTTPRAIADVYQKLVLGTALPAEKRAVLNGWLERSTTGQNQIRAALPKGWRIAHKTGHGDYGRGNDIAVVWPPTAAPIVIAIMSDRHGYDAQVKEALIKDAAAYVIAEFA